MGISCCLRWRDFDASRVRDGYILGLAGIRGHARHLAAQLERVRSHSIATASSKSSCKQAIDVSRAGAKATPSFAREGVSDSSPEEAPRSPQDGVLLLLPAEESFGAGQWIEKTVIRGAGATRARLRRRRTPHPNEGSGAHPHGVARRPPHRLLTGGASSAPTAGRSRPQIADPDPELGRQPL